MRTTTTTMAIISTATTAAATPAIKPTFVSDTEQAMTKHSIYLFKEKLTTF